MPDLCGEAEQAGEADGWVYRLPTEAEWEYACRGGPMADKADSAFDFYFGKPTNDLLPEQANFKGNGSDGQGGIVGSEPPGFIRHARDLHEWCDDTEKAEEGASRRVARAAAGILPPAAAGRHFAIRA